MRKFVRFCEGEEEEDHEEGTKEHVRAAHPSTTNPPSLDTLNPIQACHHFFYYYFPDDHLTAAGRPNFSATFTFLLLPPAHWLIGGV